jgi:hypothetical protein
LLVKINSDVFKMHGATIKTKAVSVRITRCGQIFEI